MARNETVLSVFVASPSDVADARKRLERVVDELNFVWSRQFGVRLELVKWETHAYSDVGRDPQDVINTQLDEFDIFLGIMWKRFGKPTPRAESGTQEEFQRARARYKRDPGKLRLMFFFKDASPRRLSDVDPDDLAAVKQFRRDVSDSGILYFPYRTLNEFEKLARQHLAHQIQEWGKSWGGDSAVAQSKDVPDSDSHEGVAGSSVEPTAIVDIVRDRMAAIARLRQREEFDPEAVQLSFLEAQISLDSSPDNDGWGKLAAQQAAALVIVALASRLERNGPAEKLTAGVCDSILALRGLHIDWSATDAHKLFDLTFNAHRRHDDDVLLWIKHHAFDENTTP